MITTSNKRHCGRPPPEITSHNTRNPTGKSFCALPPTACCPDPTDKPQSGKETFPVPSGLRAASKTPKSDITWTILGPVSRGKEIRKGLAPFPFNFHTVPMSTGSNQARQQMPSRWASQSLGEFSWDNIAHQHKVYVGAIGSWGPEAYMSLWSWVQALRITMLD